MRLLVVWVLGVICGWLVAARFPARAQQTLHRIEAWWIRFMMRRKGV